MALALSQALLADSTWLRLTADGLEVLSGAGTATGREVLQRIGQIRHVIETRAGSRNLTPLPVRVVVFPSERAFAPFRIGDSAAGYYASGSDRDYIVIRADAPDLYRVVFHEYVHLVLHRAGVEAPTWFNEGTAEVYSTTDLGSRDVRIGQPIPAHIAILKDSRLLPLTDLFRVNHTSLEYNERNKSGLFYAESWALVHMLNFAPAYRPEMPKFVDLLLTGTTAEEALQASFHKSPKKVFSDLTDYIDRGQFAGVSFPTRRFQAAGKATPERLGEADSDLALADLLIAIHRPDPAEQLLRKAAAKHLNNPVYETALGDVALARKEDQLARKHYECAMKLGSTSARLRLDYALILRELGSPDSEVVAALKEALRLDPGLTQAREVLETTELQMSAGRLKIAPKHPYDEGSPVSVEKLSGTLTQVDCLGNKARLHITPHLFLLLTETSRGAGLPQELACGPFDRPVEIEYRPVANQTYGTSGEVTKIEFH